MASPTRWTWVWVNSRSGWWTGRPGVLQSMGLPRVGHNWATGLNWCLIPLYNTRTEVLPDLYLGHAQEKWWREEGIGVRKQFLEKRCILVNRPISFPASAERISIPERPYWLPTRKKTPKDTSPREATQMDRQGTTTTVPGPWCPALISCNFCPGWHRFWVLVSKGRRSLSRLTWYICSHWHKVAH